MELKELAHVAACQADACHAVVQQRHRPHAFAMVSSIAGLEFKLRGKKQSKLADKAAKCCCVCVDCARSMVVTGRTHYCCRHDLKELGKQVQKLKLQE